MQSETEMILSVIRMSPPQKKRKAKVMRELEYDVEPDVLSELGKKIDKRRKAVSARKKKPLSEWRNIDFAAYIRSTLLTYGLQLAQDSSTNDWIARLHDTLVDKLKDKVSNNISNKTLKDYLEWWITSHAPFAHETVSIYTIQSERNIDKFVSRFDVAPKLESKEPLTTSVDVSPESLLDVGGLSMVLCSHGIVRAYHVLRNKQTPNIIGKISSSLKDLSANGVKSALSATIQFAPYSKDDIVDFISLSKLALDFHNIQSYKHIVYQDYFSL